MLKLKFFKNNIMNLLSIKNNIYYNNNNNNNKWFNKNQKFKKNKIKLLYKHLNN